MPDMAYDTGGIRTGGSRALDAAATADSAVAHLLGATVAAGDFGDVAGADFIASGLMTHRDGYATTGHRVHGRHLDLERRAQATAAAGDQLVVDTTSAAGSITAGMR